MIIPRDDEMVLSVRMGGDCPLCGQKTGQLLLKWPGTESGRKWFPIEDLYSGDYQVHGCIFKREAAA